MPADGESAMSARTDVDHPEDSLAVPPADLDMWPGEQSRWGSQRSPPGSDEASGGAAAALVEGAEAVPGLDLERTALDRIDPTSRTELAGRETWAGRSRSTTGAQSAPPHVAEARGAGASWHAA